jgi:hypothetical protein
LKGSPAAARFYAFTLDACHDPRAVFIQTLFRLSSPS